MSIKIKKDKGDILIKVKSLNEIKEDYNPFYVEDGEEGPSYWKSEEDQNNYNRTGDWNFCVAEEDLEVITWYPKASYERAKWYIKEIVNPKNYPEFFI